MNPSTGNLVRKETSISVTLQDNYMLFSKDLVTYILINQHVLHKYANEDVSLGTWFIGLDAEHIDDQRLCYGTPPGNDYYYMHFFLQNMKIRLGNNFHAIKYVGKSTSDLLCNMSET